MTTHTDRIEMSLGLTLNIGDGNYLKVIATGAKDVEVIVSEGFDDLFHDLEDQVVDKVQRLYDRLIDEGILK